MEDLWTVRKRSDDENYEIKPFNSAATDAQLFLKRGRIKEFRVQNKPVRILKVLLEQHINVKIDTKLVK